MSAVSNLKYFYISNFSNPSCDRAIYKAIKRNKASSILEIGMSDGRRADNMIRIANKFSGSGSVRYTAIDSFEANVDSKLTLKDCHQRLNQLGAKIQLVPGEIYPSIHRIANSHTRTDVVIISAGFDENSLDNSWYYMPRMLHATSLVFLQKSDDLEGKFEKLSRLDIERKVKIQPAKNVRAA